MSTASISKSAIGTAVFLFAVAGWVSSIRHERAGAEPASFSSAYASPDGPRSVEWYKAQPNVLRARLDPAHGWIWTLNRDGVEVYDARSDRKLRSISLPDWIWVDEFHPCLPDLAIGPGGQILVSSNVVPVLWRIDTTSFQVSRRELEVSGRNGREFGFSGLRYLPRYGAYAAVNGLDGSLWRIDAALTRAEFASLLAPAESVCEAQPLSLQTHF